MNAKNYSIKGAVSFSIIGKHPIDLANKVYRWQNKADSSSLNFHFNYDNQAEEIIKGNYKGIRWQIGVKELSMKKQIYFSSWGFTSFLFQRLVLLPVIKKELLNIDSFSFLGSCFKHRNSLFIILGLPGSGKTTLLLDAIKHGAEFVGDNELAIFSDGTITPIFNEIELRFQTAKQSLLWNRLSSNTKIYLHCTRILSVLTFGRICFNKIFTTSELGLKIKDGNLNYNKINFIYLNGSSIKENVSKEVVLKGVQNYEIGYQKNYGKHFFNEDDLERSLELMSSTLNNCQCWKMPLNSRFTDLVEM